MSWTRIMECVPNFSEGRDLQKIDQIVSPFRAKAGIKLLDYSNDEDHNRLVVTVVGEPEALKEAVIEAIGVAVKLIDLNQHQGQHPRMGAADVVPFIPIKGCTMEEAIAISKSDEICFRTPYLKRSAPIQGCSFFEMMKIHRKKH